ncbi:hypothetical protein ACTFIZ_012467 [Dictyostelium cf. discoideum]
MNANFSQVNNISLYYYSNHQQYYNGNYHFYITYFFYSAIIIFLFFQLQKINNLINTFSRNNNNNDRINLNNNINSNNQSNISSSSNNNNPSITPTKRVFTVKQVGQIEEIIHITIQHLKEGGLYFHKIDIDNKNGKIWFEELISNEFLESKNCVIELIRDKIANTPLSLFREYKRLYWKDGITLEQLNNLKPIPIIL